MTTTQLRMEVRRLTTEMLESLHRPLFVEIGLGHESIGDGDNDDGKKRQRREQGQHSWNELLSRAADLLPFMTPDEHGQISNLAAIVLLGCLPNSAGMCGARVLKSQRSISTLSQDPVAGLKTFEASAVWNLDIAEALENALVFLSSQGSFSVGGATEHQVFFFRRLLQSGVASFLACRPAHLEKICLLQLLALAVSPTARIDLSDGHVSGNHSPALYGLVYADRRDIVRALSEFLVLPDLAISSPGDCTSALFRVALPLMRATLSEFAAGALSAQDSHSALVALTNLSTQSGCYLKEQFDLLLRSINSANEASCPCTPVYDDVKWSLANSKDSVCYIRKAGSLLGIVLARCFDSDAFEDISEANSIDGYEIVNRKKASEQIAALISDLLEQWRSRKTGHNIALIPCKLKALLSVAMVLFRSKSAVFERSVDSEDDLKRSAAPEEREKIIELSIELLTFPNLEVVYSASSLLSLAFSSTGSHSDVAAIKRMFGRTKHWFLRRGVNLPPETSEEGVPKEGGIVTTVDVPDFVCAFQPLLATISRTSSNFANAVCKVVVKSNQETDSKPSGFADKCMAEKFRTLSILANCQPQIVSRYLAGIEALLQHDTGHQSCDSLSSSQTNREAERSHFVAILLSCCSRSSRQEVRDSLLPRIYTHLKEVRNPWTLYKLARHAMVTGNFGVARDLFVRVQREGPLSKESSFLWLDALSRTAEAEDLVQEKGAIGIPEAVSALSSASATSLSVTRSSANPGLACFSFQQRLLTLRRDFFELCLCTRGLSGEVSLTGPTALRQTRSHLHQRNVAPCFAALAKRYHSLYLFYGPFISQHSRTAVRSLSSICMFLSDMAGVCFLEAQPGETHQTRFGDWARGDRSHPCIRLVQNLDEQIAQPMVDSVDPSVRASVLAEVLDVVLKSPVPFPREFWMCKSLGTASVRVFADPLDSSSSGGSDTDDDGKDRLNNMVHAEGTHAEVIQVPCGFTCSLCISGMLPPGYLTCTTPITHVGAWYRLTYDGQLISNVDKLDDEDGSEIDEDEVGVPAESLEKCWSQIMPRGKFLLPIECTPMDREGYYRVDIRLACWDAAGNEWDVPMMANSCVTYLCVAQGKEQESSSLL